MTAAALPRHVVKTYASSNVKRAQFARNMWTRYDCDESGDEQLHLVGIAIGSDSYLKPAPIAKRQLTCR